MRLIFFLILATGLLFVQAQENTETTEKEGTEVIKPTDNTEVKEAKKEEITPDTFDPTEKLSEDIPGIFLIYIILLILIS